VHRFRDAGFTTYSVFIPMVVVVQPKISLILKHLKASEQAVRLPQLCHASLLTSHLQGREGNFEMANELTDNTRHPAPAARPDAEQTSRHLLEEVNRLHVASFARNKSDNADSATLGVKADKRSIALADQTMAQANELQNYLDKGGNFSDEEGKKLGAQFISQLRREADDHRRDRAGAREFVGKGLAEPARQQALKDSDTIGDAAKTLADPKASDQDRAKALEQIGKSADSIGKGLHDSTGRAGKDQKDALAENAVIAADVKALQGANLTPEQRTLLANDIASKAGLIKNDMHDAIFEKPEVDHDTAALKSGANMEVMLRYAMAHPGHAGKALEQLRAGLSGLENGEGTGTLEAVKIDRQQDMVTEPFYISANTADNAQNSQIIQFTNPYADAARQPRR
jgi:hypothetical protein